MTFIASFLYLPFQKKALSGKKRGKRHFFNESFYGTFSSSFVAKVRRQVEDAL
jgi:hypothetical protein|tara:strand:- start:206 stop:364 length:159 start_codon:yes stop_codon:yes gene_type:complete